MIEAAPAYIHKYGAKLHGEILRHEIFGDAEGYGKGYEECGQYMRAHGMEIKVGLIYGSALIGYVKFAVMR